MASVVVCHIQVLLSIEPSCGNLGMAEMTAHSPLRLSIEHLDGRL